MKTEDYRLKAGDRSVVILLSDKRSGSTMVQSELCKHSDIQHVTYSPHTYFETHHWLKAACMLDMDSTLFADGKIYGGYGGKKNARIYMEDCIIKNVPEFIAPIGDRELVFSGWDALCEKYACPVFFEKSPQILANKAALMLLLEWIEQTDYTVKIIGLVRNPMSVMYSAQELFHTNPEKRQWGWLNTHKNLMWFKEQLSNNNFLLCRYEDIIKSPQQEFRKICSFIGVSFDDNVGGAVHSKSNNKWANDPFFRLQLDDAVKDMARKLGCCDDDFINPEKPLPSLVQRMRRRIYGSMRLLVSRIYDRIFNPHRLKRQ